LDFGAWWSRATAVLEQQSPRKFDFFLNDLKPTWLFRLLYFAPCRPLGQRAPSSQACRHMPPPPAGAPEAHAEFFCRRRQRYKHASVVERPPQSYDQRLKLVVGASARRLTYHFADKAGYIYSSPLHICRVVLLLLRQRRGAGLGELSNCNSHVAEANISRPHPPAPSVLCTVPDLERLEW